MTKSVTPNAKATEPPEDLSQQIDALRVDLAKLFEIVANDTVEEITKTGRQLSQSGRDAREQATKTVLDHPLASLGIAAAVGLLLGMTLRKT